MLAGSDISLWMAFSAGVISFVSPCVMPLVPSYISYISGLSFKQVQMAHPDLRVRLAILMHSIAFIVGFSTVFVGLGALAGFASSTFQQFMQDGLIWIQRVGGLLVFLFGVHMSGLFHFGVLLGDKRVHLQHKPAGLIGTFIVGLAFAAGWTPCIGPVLGTILLNVASSSGGVEEGVILLSAYSAGLGLPFLLSGLLFHAFLTFFNRFKKYIRIVELVTGVLLMVIGVMLAFDLFGRLTGYLYRWLPVTG
jgi:cytochrome c-type biogenesis protein